MTGLELLDAHPTAAKTINDFYHKKMIESMDTEDVPDEFKEMLKQQTFDNEYVAKFVDASPSILFEIFDNADIYIGITPIYKTEAISYRYTINTLLSGEESTRKQAEAKAVELAFKLLNDKL